MKGGTYLYYQYRDLDGRTRQAYLGPDDAKTAVLAESPERFALHKLLVSESRGTAFATKAEKDRRQAVQILEVLMEEMPDELAPAREELVARGKGRSDKLARALRKVKRGNPQLAAWVAGNATG